MYAKNKKKINFPKMLTGIRVSESDYAKLKADAMKTGLKFTEHCRQLLTTGRSVNTDALAAVRREINKVGTNINQIAHQANASGHDSAMYDDILKELSKLREKIGQHAI